MEVAGDTDMKNFQMVLEETRTLVKESLTNRDRRPSYMSEKQLIFILNELNKMERIRNIHFFCPFYPKGISDSWDYSNPLSIKLLELLELYREL